MDVTLPEMGESVTQGAIVEWRKGVGEFVAEGDPLVEVTTDKVDVEVPATVSGVVTQIAAKEGDTVAVGSLLAKIDTSKTNGAPAKKSVAKKNGASAPQTSAQAGATPPAVTPPAGKSLRTLPRSARLIVSTSISNSCAAPARAVSSCVPTWRRKPGRRAGAADRRFPILP